MNRAMEITSIQKIRLEMRCECGLGIDIHVTGKGGTARTKECRFCRRRYDYSCWKIRGGDTTMHRVDAYLVKEGDK